MTVAQPSAEPQAATTGTPAQTAWVEEIKDSLAMYKTNYPTSNFAPYVTKLDWYGTPWALEIAER